MKSWTVTYRANEGGLLMVKRRSSEDWHHRVPDFKLVYCGSKNVLKKEIVQVKNERTVKIDRNEAGTKPTRHKKQKKYYKCISTKNHLTIPSISHFFMIKFQAKIQIYESN